MNELQILYFLDAAESKSFSAAAKKNLISQPAISRVISDLEKELNITLFLRGKNGVTLTNAGELYFNLFQEFEKKLQETKKRANEIGDPAKGTVFIGVLSYFNVFEELNAIKRCIADIYPCMKIEIVFCNHFRDLMDKIDSGMIHAGITVNHSIYSHSETKSLVLSKSNRIIVFSKNYPLENKSKLTPKDFKNEPFIVVDAKGNGSKQIRKFCEPYGFNPVIINAQGTEDLIMHLQALKGVSIVDPWLRFTIQNEFSFISTDEETQLVLTWKVSQDNPTLQLLIKVLSQIHF